MKQKFTFNLIIALNLILGVSFRSLAQMQFPDEPKIQLSEYMMDGSVANVKQALFLERYKSNNQPNNELNHIADLIQADKFIELYNKTKTIVPASICSGEQCMTGLRLILGIDGDKITILYQPIYLLRTKQDGNKQFFSANDVGDKYRFNGIDFESFPSNSVEDKYEKDIRIQRFRKRGKPSPIHPNDGSWKADTRQVIYTFQEIIGFYDRVTATPGNYSGKLALHNGASFYKRMADINIFPTWRAKHSIFISLDTWTKENSNAKILGFIAETADFAHLCPPKCNDFEYIMQ
jgi:hypothetical protein